jgi:hypothetical protein
MVNHVFIGSGQIGFQGASYRRKERGVNVGDQSRRVLELARLTDERRRVGHAARDYIASERQWRNNAEQLLTLVPAGVAA